MAVNAITTATIASRAIRAERRPVRLVVRSTRLAQDAAPAATHSDRARDPGMAAGTIAERVLAETWGWS